jgi:hypothetical protein
MVIDLLSPAVSTLAKSCKWLLSVSGGSSISIKIGRPESIKEEDISAPMPQPLPQLDDSQINSNIQQQIANANLTRILNRVVQQG